MEYLMLEKMNRVIVFVSVVWLLTGLGACTKDFLEARPDQSLLIPRTLSDFNALLDNSNNFNISPALGHIASDDVTITDNGWLALTTVAEKNSYYWADDVFEESSYIGDWNIPYIQVFYSNIVLDGLKELDPAVNAGEYRRVKGSALFYRAFAFYNLAQVFCAPFNDQQKRLPGIPLKLTADVNEKPGRGTIEETYSRILTDLKEAVSLLPEEVSYKSRPDKAAALAMLSRVYLSMQDYEHALQYANEALTLNHVLIDYNGLNASASRPLPAALPNGNEEVLFYSSLLTYRFNSSSLVYAAPDLYALYGPGDLRKTVLFNASKNYKGSYSGNSRLFDGLATDELYLNKAECLARLNDVPGSLEVLNALLRKRYAPGQFSPRSASSSAEALALVLAERRKELIGRGLRWIDLRRLNMESATAVTLTKVLNGVTYTLEPGSAKYVFPIPGYELRLNNLEQNPR